MPPQVRHWDIGSRPMRATPSTRGMDLPLPSRLQGLLLRVPIQAAPRVLVASRRGVLQLDGGIRRYPRDAQVVVADVAEGQARRQAPALGPREVRDEAGGLPTADRSRLRAPIEVPAEEGEPASFEVEAHGALEALARGDRGQRLDVGALDLPRGFADLPLSDDGAGVRAEGDAAATARLEVDHGEADVVRVREHLHFQVHTDAATSLQHIGAQLASRERDLVRLLDGRDLEAAERRPEKLDLRGEAEISALPRPTDDLPAGASHRLRGAVVRRVEDRVAVQLQAVEGPATERPPRPAAAAVQLPSQAARAIGPGQVPRAQLHRDGVVRAIGQVGEDQLATCASRGRQHGIELGRRRLPTAGARLEEPPDRAEGALVRVDRRDGRALSPHL
mmetsp:Transcript_6272/g.17997  ORF Transcript_6272/g.17997 Transcript_6272/m.17997 type:complete len:391 (+) Transcript_6272:47-1219(+)